MISLWILADGSQGKTLASAKARTQPEVGTEGARPPVIWGWRRRAWSPLLPGTLPGAAAAPLVAHQGMINHVAGYHGIMNPEGGVGNKDFSVDPDWWSSGKDPGISECPSPWYPLLPLSLESHRGS